MVYLIHTLGRYVLGSITGFLMLDIIEHYRWHLKAGFLYIFVSL